MTVKIREGIIPFFLPQGSGFGQLREMTSLLFCARPSLSCLGTIALIGMLLVQPGSVGAEMGEESKRRLKVAEKEIDHLRDNLHEAQRELAAKSERIEDLEKELEKWRRAGGSEGRREKPKAKAKPAVVEKNRKVPEPPKPSPALQQKTPAFEVVYEANSAVNYEGRENALAWLREQLGENPDFTFQVLGWADDSTYPEANRTIAANRAKYLADYLVLSGIPRERIFSVGVGEGKGGRRARILASNEGAEVDDRKKSD